MNAEIDVHFEPLPGYRLIERLGVGGYGEVWRVEAPGGLTKAIKFVFGKHHEKRAAHEQRALDRVRLVRHPFLLSLERIEVVDGRLVVVTELADGSIKDRFESCREQGLAGIPRDELIGYLRDAADALDFMAQSHALQHLDIKPENLLLLAGHVKVADFGLVKDVRQSQTSLVGGLTPLYAAPEVFRGTPSTHSDQYSLAIVYQEMMTGTLPFSGTSAAELTLQHLNEEPDLTPLPPADRYAVCRALAKEAEHRYATCREFIDALLKPADGVRSQFGGQTNATLPPANVKTTPLFGDGAMRASSQTDLFDDDATTWNALAQDRLVEPAPPDARLVDLPRLDLAAEEGRAVPTLVLGIGGSAGKVLARFKQSLAAAARGAEIPSVQTLLLDTDAKALADASGGERGLAPEETLHTPLRRPQHYREHSQQLLQWLSRRWLYNIPRTLRTEGLRPLGRLALADHARQTGQRVRRAIAEALEPTAVESSSQALGREFCPDKVRVYVVASISGGTGGGMSLDMGYLVRAVLDNLGVGQSSIVGIMMHATSGDPRHCELARVNAYSWLTELHHFQQPENSYPGDVSCGLPSHEPGIPAFDYTYVVHLGENLDDVAFEQAADQVGDYLRYNVLTPAGAFFEACRRTESGIDRDGAALRSTVRSFGLEQCAAASREPSDVAAKSLARSVLTRWRTGAESAATERDSPLTLRGVAPLVRRLQLSAQGLASNARAVVEMRLGASAQEFLPTWLAQQACGPHAAESEQLQAIDRIFAMSAIYGEGKQANAILGEPTASLLSTFADKLHSEIRRWVLARFDEPNQRAAGVEQAVRWVGDHFRAVELELQHYHQLVGEKLVDLRRAVEKGMPSPQVTAGAQQYNVRALNYLRLRLDSVALSGALNTAQQIMSGMVSIGNEIATFDAEVNQCLAAVSRAENANTAESPGDAATSPLPKLDAAALGVLDTRRDELVAEIDRRLQVEFVDQHGGLLALVLQGGRLRAQLIARLQEIAGQSILASLAAAHVHTPCIMAADATGENDVRSALAAATPPLLQFGGTRRVLAVLPADSAPHKSGKLIARLGVPATTLTGDDTALTLCVEAGQLPLQHIAVDFVQRRRDRIEFAERVHSRTDIVWSPLLGTADCSTPFSWESNVTGSVANEASKTLVI